MEDVRHFSIFASIRCASMIRTTAIFLIVLTLGASVREWAIYGIFRINQDAIAAAFCINQDKPELKCNGHCFLKEKLSADRQDKAPPSPLPKNEQEKNPVFYFGVAQSVLMVFTADQQFWIGQETLKPRFFPDNCFHPPERTV